MAYNFKKLSDVALQEVTTENTNVYVDENGEIKRISANKFGAVKTVNGASPDESGNVSIEIPEGFSGSWNDLTDKPFYETEVMGDILTWDGNPDGLTSVPVMDGAVFVKISEAVPAIEDFQNGATVSLFVPGIPEPVQVNTVPVEECATFFEFGMGAMYIVQVDNFNADGVVFPEKGVYSILQPGIYCGQLTIPGYTGFLTKTVKPIDKKYLPADIGGGNDVMIIKATPSDPFYDGEDGAEIELSKTASEIFFAWAVGGKSMIVTGIEGLLPVTAVYGEDGFLCHGLVGESQMRAVGYRIMFDGATCKIYKDPPRLCDMQFVNLWFESSDYKMYKLDVDDNGYVIAVPEGGFVPT